MDINEMQHSAVENRRQSVILPKNPMLAQATGPFTYQYHVQVASSSSASTGKGRGQSARSSLSPPQDNQEKIVTPSSSTSTVHPQQTCCIIDKNQRCHQYVGSNVYNKGLQKRVKAVKSLQIKADSRARHIGMCDYHSTMIDGVIRKNLGKSRKRNGNSRHSDTESNDEDETEVKSPGIDFSRFPLATLQKYKKFFSIPGQLSKGQLTDAITRHFKTVPVLKNEKEIIQDFVLKVKYSGGGHERAVEGQD